MGLSECCSKTLLFILEVTQLLLVKGRRGPLKAGTPLAGTKESRAGKVREEDMKHRQKKARAGWRTAMVARDRRKERERRHAKGERHEKVSAARSDPP